MICSVEEFNFVINYRNFTEYFEKYNVATGSKICFFYAPSLLDLLLVMEYRELEAYQTANILCFAVVAYQRVYMSHCSVLKTIRPVKVTDQNVTT